LTAPDGRLFSFTYDGAGRQTGVARSSRPGTADPALTTQTSYDAAGRAVRMKRASGKTLTFAYDNAGRPTTQSTSEGTSVSSRYAPMVDGAGGLLASTETGEGAETAFKYDGPLVTEIDQVRDTAFNDATGPAPAVTFGYDGALRPATESIAGDTVSYAYNDDDQPTAIGPITFAYDDVTGDATLVTAGVTTTAQQLDGHGDLAARTSTTGVGSGAQTVLAESISRDDLGRIARRTVSDDTGTHTDEYTYDQAGRLTQVARDGAVAETFGYDATGALVTRGAGLLAGQFTLDGYGRPVAAPDGSQITWSEDGEETTLSTDGHDATHFAYDGFGRLVTVTLPDGRTGSYRYDALGRRTAVRLDGTLVRRYLYGGTLWPRARLDASGDVLER